MKLAVPRIVIAVKATGRQAAFRDIGEGCEGHPGAYIVGVAAKRDFDVVKILA